MPFCAECGAKLGDGVKFCAECGTKVAEEIKQTPAPAPVEAQGYQPPCPACGKPLTSGKVTVRGEEYHIGCYTCHKCTKQLSKRIDKSIERDGKLLFYCNDCVDSNGTLLELWRKQNPDKIPKPTAVAASETSGDGCYLTFVDADQGALVLNWSHTPVPNAIAYQQPGKPIPGFKYKSAGGKSNLKKGCGGVHKKELHTGWCSFVKMTKGNKGSITLLDEKAAGVWLLRKDNAVLRLTQNSPQDMADIIGVAAANHNFNGYEGANGALKLDSATFRMNCGSEGFAMDLS